MNLVLPKSPLLGRPSMDKLLVNLRIAKVLWNNCKPVLMIVILNFKKNRIKFKNYRMNFRTVRSHSLIFNFLSKQKKTLLRNKWMDWKINWDNVKLVQTKSLHNWKTNMDKLLLNLITVKVIWTNIKTDLISVTMNF